MNSSFNSTIHRHFLKGPHISDVLETAWARPTAETHSAETRTMDHGKLETGAPTNSTSIQNG